MPDFDIDDLPSIKNEYGLPTGELVRDSQPEGEIVEEEEVVEEEVDEVYEDEEEPAPEEEEESSEEEISFQDLFDDEVPEVSDESELDRLRRTVSVLEGRLQEQSAQIDRAIRQDPQVSEEDEDEDIDLTKAEVRQRLAEAFQEDPGLIPIFTQQYVDRRLKKYGDRIDKQDVEAKQAAIYTEQKARLQTNLAAGLRNAAQYGPIEQALVQEVQSAIESGDASKSHVLVELLKNPAQASSAEGIEGVVTRLAKKAEERAKAKGLDLSTIVGSTASSRGKRLIKKQQTKSTPQKVDAAEETFNRLRAAGKSPLSGLLGG